MRDPIAKYYRFIFPPTHPGYKVELCVVSQRYGTFATGGRWLLALVMAGQANEVGILRFCLERFVID
jgi:hypothetical protein